MTLENVPHDEWLELLHRSEQLQALARHAQMTGGYREHRRLWQQISPLNRRIRKLAMMPTTKDSWPTRKARRQSV